MRSWLLRVRRVIVVVALAVGATAPVAALGAPGAGAAVRPVVGCGYSFGPVIPQGAAGTEFFQVVLRPANPAQNCSTSVAFTASLAPASATVTSYTDINNNPLTAAETVTFVPGRQPPSLLVGWNNFHCADPPVPGNFAITAGTQHATVGVSPTTCSGGRSALVAVPPVSPISAVGIAPTSDDHGYRTVNTLGVITPEGDASSFGAPLTSNAPIVGIQGTTVGDGAWVAAADGGVFTYGTAAFHGSLGGTHLNRPVVGIGAMPDGGGYYLVAGDGGVFAFGDAVFHGSLGGMHLNAPVVGIAVTPDGGGYYLVAADGGVFTFGDAHFAGSLGSVVLNAPIIGMAAGPHGGYWLVATDGGVFTFGGVPFQGSLGGTHINSPISGMAATFSGNGYWLVGADNGVYAFGDANFYGSSPFAP
jgi:hypothetical protein